MCSPDAPDMTAQNAIAASQAAMSRETLDWAKQVFKDTAPERAEASKRAMAQSDLQLESQRKQNALTDDYAAYNRDTFRPLEKTIVANAAAYDTPERREAAAAAASADVDTQVANQRAASAREMARMGVSPSSGKVMAMNGLMDLGAAKLRVGAANGARTQVETLGAAKMMDAASIGRNLPGNQATSAGIALQQGNSSTNNALLPTTVNAQGQAIMQGGFTGAQQGLAQAGNTYGNIAQQQATAAGSNSGVFSTLGALAGTAMQVYSDEDLKKDISTASPDEALEAIEKTPVKNWAYKAGTKASDGGKPHTGPMAQDVQKNMGDKTAPNGKKIDLLSMNGIAMNAIKAVNRKVDTLMAMQGIPLAA